MEAVESVGGAARKMGKAVSDDGVAQANAEQQPADSQPGAQKQRQWDGREIPVKGRRMALSDAFGQLRVYCRLAFLPVP